MSNWIPISTTGHAQHYWHASTGFVFAQKQQVVPVMLAEISRLLPHYVLCFVNQGGRFQITALVGLGGERNLYVNNDGRWLCDYIPASLRGYPFALLENQNGEKVFCIDRDHLAEDAEDGKPLFQEDGKLAESSGLSLAFLSQCDENRQLTFAACQALEDAGLIKEWEFKIEYDNDMEPSQLKGLYMIDEARLQNMDAVEFAALRASGALQLAYAQLFSISQRDQLVQRFSLISKQLVEAAKVETVRDVFADEGMINFDALDLKF